MNPMSLSTSTCSERTHELRFQSLHRDGHGMAFACDSAGQVNLDQLPERARNDYLFARAMMGRQFAFPVVAGH